MVVIDSRYSKAILKALRHNSNSKERRLIAKHHATAKVKGNLANCTLS